MKKVLVSSGGVILLLIIVVALPPSDPHRQDRIGAEQSHLLGVYSYVWTERAASDFQLTVPQAVEKTTKEKAVAYLRCPIHEIPYILNPDSAKWHRTNRTSEVAMFCPQLHYNRVITAQFNGAVGRIKSPPEWSKR